MPTFSTQPTPNPDSLKITTSGSLFMDNGMAAFASAEEAETNPLARRLFAVPGVVNLFVTPDFLTLTKSTGAHWDQLLPKVKKVLEDHFAEQDA